ncbi:hypothetical protein ACJ7K1_31965 [Paenibacillus elgii]
MRKENYAVLLSLLSLIISGWLVISDLTYEKKIETPPVPASTLRGDFSLNQGGVYTSVTQNGDLWIYISNQDKFYFISKPDANGKFNVTSDTLLKKQ